MADVKKRATSGAGKCYYSLIGDNGSYGEVKFLGKLVEVSATHNIESTESYADDSIYLQEKNYKSTDVSLTVYDIPKYAEADLFGHKISKYGGIIESKDDFAPYIALMFEETVSTETGNHKEYVTLFKGKMSEAEIKAKTREGSVEYQTKQYSGTFQSTEAGDYSLKVRSDDEDFVAVDWEAIWTKTVPTADVKA